MDADLSRMSNMPAGHGDAFQHYILEASRYYDFSAFEEATRALDAAEAQESSRSMRNQVLIKKKRGEIERRKGHYDEAIALLEIALAMNGDAGNLQHIELTGELGVCYLNQDNYDQAQKHFVLQHSMARMLIDTTEDRPTKVAAQAQACRAMGNLGLSKLQVALTMPASESRYMFTRAIFDLKSRVTIAENLLMDMSIPSRGDPGNYRAKVIVWQGLGLDRLALCHTAIGDHERAISYGEESVKLSAAALDPSNRALSRFYYGNALYAAGRVEEAKKQWDYGDDLSTPAIIFCKEPSEESVRNLRKLRELAVGFDRYDNHGYSALDYALLSEHDKCAAIVVRGLRDELDTIYPNDEWEVERQVDIRKAESRRRKYYREIFQHTFRPVLSEYVSGSRAEDRIAALRQRYADDLRRDLRKRQVFDTFNILSCSSFRALRRLPNPTDHNEMDDLRAMAKDDPLKHFQQSDRPPYVIFFSYEWLGKTAGLPGEPDDHYQTQYMRMLNAIETLLASPAELTGIPDLTEDRIFVWLDVTSIDQINSEPGAQDRGVSALPLVIALCNIMIGLSSETYLTRAWCAVEVLMMQRLRSYGFHQYLEHTLSKTSSTHGSLVAADRLEEVNDVGTNDAKYGITKDEDRASIRFLVRQSELLEKQDAFDASTRATSST